MPLSTYQKTYLATMLLLYSPAVFANSTPSAFDSGQTPQDIQALVNFMTTSIGSLPLRVKNNQSGLTYTGSATPVINGKILPLSYYSTPAYWGQYVCALPGNSCNVIDSFNSSNYTVNPKSGISGDLQIERVNVSNGADIYDAATWQMAVQLAAINNVIGPNGEQLNGIADNQTLLLNYGSDGNADYGNGNTSPDQNRANTSAFTYNGNQIQAPEKAFFYRMVPAAWFAYDPLYGTQYAKIIGYKLPKDNSAYKPGLITWQDWKPITGENAWGFLIGPLQTAWLRAQDDGQKYIDFHSPAVKNAINILDSFRHMQSQIGAVYYEPAGGEDNGGAPVSPYNVSVENNASTLAGLTILQSVLQSELDYQSDLSDDNKTQLNQAMTDINIMLYGGALPTDSNAPYKTTAGLLSFFKNNAYDAKNGIFYQGGSANDPSAEAPWMPTIEPKAVDVNTWGITVLGQPTTDQMFGFGAAYQMWQNVKDWGGYYGADNQLWGVGYSDEDGNGSTHLGQGIMSTEWSAGAINMTRALITQYTVVAHSSGKSIYTPQQKAQAAHYVESLTRDEESMVAHLNTLRTDQYAQTNSPFLNVAPPNYTQLINLNAGQLGFVYSSKRYDIPFGWWANPLPSTTSVAWPVMLYYNFNPFALGGTYTAPDFVAPPSNAPPQNPSYLPAETTAYISNQVKDASKLGVNYGYWDASSQTCNTTNLTYGPQINGLGGTVTLPENVCFISIAYTVDNNNWYGACNVDSSNVYDIYGDAQGKNGVSTINAVWTNSQGSGACPIVAPLD